jgi:hypothetical protein
VDRAARSRDMASDPAGRCWPRWHAEPADMCRNFGLDRPRLVSAWTATGARNAAAGPGWVCPGPAAVGSGLCVGHQVLLSVCGRACQLTVVPARRVSDGWRAGGGCAGQAVGPVRPRWAANDLQWRGLLSGRARSFVGDHRAGRGWGVAGVVPGEPGK